MGSPIAHGVFKALDKQRRTVPPAGKAPGSGWLYFVLTTLCLSWMTAGILTARLGPPDGLWSASLFYAGTMGWQPVVAAWLARSWRDAPVALNGGLRWPKLGEIGIAIVVASGLAGAAMLVAYGFGERVMAPRTNDGAALLFGALLLLCLQAATEEYGWRGAPMSYAIERWGSRTGLVVHGLVWGAWYAPLFLVASPAPIDSLLPAAGFVLTCLLLGIVLGWLRLRSHSIAPPAIANAMLTIMAGLPLLFHHSSAGVRDAVFRWPGLPVLAVTAAFVLLMSSRTSTSASPPSSFPRPAP